MRAILVALLSGALACAQRTPRVDLPPLAGGTEAFVAAHPLAAGENIRVDEVGRMPSASYHLVQVRCGESPHRHETHDLTVHVLAGHGTLDLGARRLTLDTGDVAVIPRGEVHWFTNRGRGNALALVVFSPPLDAPDSVPAPGR
jgi:mannose-6-phosphate isomerase-like protein (cupin superfamily)